MAKKKHRLLKMAGVSALALTGAALTHNILCNNEKKQIKEYGFKLDTPFGKINIATYGESGETIVLLPGFGNASPILDFEPFAKQLAKFARVITIEYLGYGDSDDSDNERTIENICGELHYVLEKLNIKDCYLMPHSISGVYALAYTNYYPNEVKGVLLIDTSVPTQNEKINPKTETILNTILHATGLIRPYVKKGSKNLKNYDADTITQMKLRAIQKPTKAIRNEDVLLNENMNKCKEMKWDDNLPVLLFLCSKTIEVTKGWWLNIHEEQLENVLNSKLVILEGTHMLYHNNAETMAEEVKTFIKA